MRYGVVLQRPTHRKAVTIVYGEGVGRAVAGVGEADLGIAITENRWESRWQPAGKGDPRMYCAVNRIQPEAFQDTTIPTCWLLAPGWLGSELCQDKLPRHGWDLLANLRAEEGMSAGVNMIMDVA